jgi:enoyl reductase-like protein
MDPNLTRSFKLSLFLHNKDLDVAALNFDTLEYVKQLTDAGVERQVAEIHAITVGRAMGMYVDNLVTKGYLDATLDARFAEQDLRIEKRFAEQDAKFEKRFAEQDAKFEKRFNALERRIDDRVAPLELAVQSIQVTQRFQSGLLLILVAGLLVPPVLNLINSIN